MVAITDVFARLVQHGKAQNHLDCLLDLETWISETLPVQSELRAEVLDELDVLWGLYLANVAIKREANADFSHEARVVSAVEQWARGIEEEPEPILPYHDLAHQLETSSR